MSIRSEMKPGRELDALVAERVMGWKAGTMPRGTLAWMTDDTGEWIPRESFNPSTSITSAWGVIEKLIKDHPDWYPEVHPSSHQHYCKIWRNTPGSNSPESYGWLAEEYGRSDPHAICLAAIKAVGFTE